MTTFTHLNEGHTYDVEFRGETRTATIVEVDHNDDRMPYKVQVNVDGNSLFQWCYPDGSSNLGLWKPVYSLHPELISEEDPLLEILQALRGSLETAEPDNQPSAHGFTVGECYVLTDTRFTEPNGKKFQRLVVVTAVSEDTIEFDYPLGAQVEQKRWEYDVNDSSCPYVLSACIADTDGELMVNIDA